jgi:hypothetical protein
MEHAETAAARPRAHLQLTTMYEASSRTHARTCS